MVRTEAAFTSGRLINGTAIAEQLLGNLRRRVTRLIKLGHRPHLAVVLVGNDKPSLTYVRRKQLAAKRIGVRFSLEHLPASTSHRDLEKKLRAVQRQKDLSGLIVQLPLPHKFKTKKTLQLIDPQFDVDCLTDVNIGRLLYGVPYTVPPTPDAILEILRELSVPLIGKHIVVVGAGELVGKPLSAMLLQWPVTLTVCNKSTPNLFAETRRGDIVITAVGKANLITGAAIKPGAIVIDAGVSFPDGKMSGDVQLSSVRRRASLVTPTPGGVGPITVAKLLQNTVAVAEAQHDKKHS